MYLLIQAEAECQNAQSQCTARVYGFEKYVQQHCLSAILSAVQAWRCYPTWKVSMHHSHGMNICYESNVRNSYT